MSVSDTEQLIAVLQDCRIAESAGGFPSDRVASAQPGLYAWWADEEGLVALSDQLGNSLSSLIYARQAGAGRSTATLRSRIVDNHIRGNIRASTFRRTLAAILREPLDLVVAGPNRLNWPSEQCLSNWIRQHLSVVTLAYPDRQKLAELEQLTLTKLDPPLNLRGMPPSPIRRRLRAIRRALTQGS